MVRSTTPSGLYYGSLHSGDIVLFVLFRRWLAAQPQQRYRRRNFLGAIVDQRRGQYSQRRLLGVLAIPIECWFHRTGTHGCQIQPAAKKRIDPLRLFQGEATSMGVFNLQRRHIWTASQANP